MSPRFAAWILVTGGIVACGGGTATRRSATDATDTTDAYPGRCELVGIEYSDVPRETDTEPEPGAVFLVARYRPSGDTSRSPFTVRFAVEQRSAETLRTYLEQHAHVACDPERGGSPDSVDVPPLESAEPER